MDRGEGVRFLPLYAPPLKKTQGGQGSGGPSVTGIEDGEEVKMAKWKKRSIVCALAVCAMVVSLGTAQALPDLVVNSITPNCGGYLFASESNSIEVEFQNVGTMNANASHANFVLSDGYSERVTVPLLAAGNSTTISITDPTNRTAGTTVTITVTADVDNEINESDETNNTLAIEKTVANNGYKGKRYTGGSDIITWQTFELQGDLLYSTGDSQYLSGSSTPWTTYTVTWNASDLPVPVSGTVKEARLYVIYTWDKVQGMPDNVSLSFNGNAQTRDAFFTDRKDHASYDYPSGMLAYHVTADFNTAGNTAILTNLNQVAGNPSLRGMVLVVIYEDESERMKTITINEEFDLLNGKSSYCTTPEEATAYAPFSGSIKLDSVHSARLITVAPGAGPNEGELLFNGQTWTDVWNYAGTSQIGIDERDVTTFLATTNEAGFQSSADSMEASNAILVVEYEEPAVRRSGSGGTPRDSDGDGYSDMEELLQGTDSSDQNDYPGKPAATPQPTATSKPTSIPTVPPVVSPAPTQTPTPTPATPTPTEPGFEAVFAIGGLVALACAVLRKRWSK